MSEQLISGWDFPLVYDGVYTILTDYPKTRNCYKALMVKYYTVICGLHLIDEIDGGPHIPHEATIERVCRDVQTDYEELRPDPESINTRRWAEWEFRKWARAQKKFRYKPKRVVTKVIAKVPLNRIEKEWRLEYDNQTNESAEQQYY